MCLYGMDISRFEYITYWMVRNEIIDTQKMLNVKYYISL